MIQLPRIVDLRGAAVEAPENTLEGFRVAANTGIGWVEFEKIKAKQISVFALISGLVLSNSINI